MQPPPSGPGPHGPYQGPPPYGPPSPQYGPPPSGYPSAPTYAARPGQPAAPVSPTKHLDDQSMIWLCVAAAGFFFGVLFVTGPLAWYFGSKLRGQYRRMGFPPNGAATVAMILGIVETALVLLIAIPLLILFFAVGLAAIAG